MNATVGTATVKALEFIDRLRCDQEGSSSPLVAV